MKNDTSIIEKTIIEQTLAILEERARYGDTLLSTPSHVLRRTWPDLTMTRPIAPGDGRNVAGIAITPTERT